MCDSATFQLLCGPLNLIRLEYWSRFFLCE